MALTVDEARDHDTVVRIMTSDVSMPHKTYQGNMGRISGRGAKMRIVSAPRRYVVVIEVDDWLFAVVENCLRHTKLHIWRPSASAGLCVHPSNSDSCCRDQADVFAEKRRARNNAATRYLSVQMAELPVFSNRNEDKLLHLTATSISKVYLSLPTSTEICLIFYFPSPVAMSRMHAV